MRLKRSQLKELVKECLREIIKEQVNPGSMLEALTPTSKPKPAQIQGAESYASITDTSKFSVLAGLGEEPASRDYINPSQRLMMSRQNERRQEFDGVLDKPSPTQNILGNIANDVSHSNQRQAPQELAGISPDVMQDIFAHTAATTLAEQNSKGHGKSVPSTGPQMPGQGYSPPADAAAAFAEKHTPSDLFPQSAGNWANLAFK